MTELAVRRIEGAGTYAYADTYLFVLCTFADACKVKMSGQTVEDLKVLLPAMEAAEKTHGAIADDDERRAFAKGIVDFLRGEGPPVSLTTGQADDIQEELREAIRRRGLTEPFTDMLEKIFAAREVMRTTTEVEEFIAARLEDGVHAAKFAHLFIEEQPHKQRLSDFKVLVSKLFNCVDTLLDAKEDYAEGQMALRPTAGFYWTLGKKTAGLFFTFFRRVPSVRSLVKVTWHVTAHELKLSKAKRAEQPLLSN